MNPNLKLDIFPHIFPQAFFERMKAIAEQSPTLAAQIKRWLHIPVLWDLEARLRMMERFPGYKQILTLSLPAIEFLAPHDQSPELARLANDGMAEIVARHPGHFPAFVASLPMNNVPEALREMERAIGKLGAKGIQIFTNVNGRPLDEPEFYPIFERMANKHDLGAMAPFFDARIGYGMDQLGTRTSDEDYTVILKRMAKRPVDYFRMFYADTSVNGSASATRCGLDFFGADHVLFGTDCPFDPEGGPLFVREIIKTIDSLKLKDDDRRKVYFGNAIRMLKLELPGAPTGVSLLPDVPNWSWHEYGMRVGFWRFHALYERLKIRPNVAINARVCIDYPRVAQACKDAGWEFMGHSYEQGPIHGEKDQQAMILHSLDTIEKFIGKRPVGWLGPGLTETYDTPEHLTAAGIKYIGDWVYDDEPTEISTANGPLVTLPYTVECNDIPMMIVQHHEAAYWTRKCIDCFERLYKESAERPKIMAIAIHPYISGQPFRIKYLEDVYSAIAKFKGVLHWNGEEILEWYLKARKEAK